MSRRLVALLSALLFSQLGTIVIQSSSDPAYPAVRSVGSFGKSVSTVRPGLPSGWAENDLFVAIFETANETITAPGGYGWTEAPNSPATHGSVCPASSDCTSVTVFYRLALASETNAKRTFSDSGNHGCGVIVAIETGTFDSSDPINIDANSDQNATTFIIIGGATTDADTTLALAVAGSAYDCNGCANVSGWANAALDNQTEIFDTSCSNGNGGSLAIMSGEMSTAQASGSVTATSTQTQARANFLLFINPL
jgi:hypothetical protein